MLPSRPSWRGIVPATVVLALAGMTASAAVATSPATSPTTAAAAVQSTTSARITTTGTQILFGSVANSVADLTSVQSKIGKQLNFARVFRNWGQPVINNDFRAFRDQGTNILLSVASTDANGVGLSYRTVANASPGSAVYDQIVSMGQQLKGFGKPIFFTYQHEPEVAAQRILGTGADYVAAWRNVNSIIKAQGANNVKFVWTLVDWSYVRTDAYAAANYWPGANYVDFIGVDAYNFYNCMSSTGQWGSLASRLAGVMRFQDRYPTKKIVIAEFSSVEDPAVAGRKAQWFDAAAQTLQQPAYSEIVAAAQWNNPPGADPCAFAFWTSNSAQQSFIRMADTPYYSAALMP